MVRTKVSSDWMPMMSEIGAASSLAATLGIRLCVGLIVNDEREYQQVDVLKKGDHNVPLKLARSYALHAPLSLLSMCVGNTVAGWRQ